MKDYIFKLPQNPIISRRDIKPSRSDYEVICAFNAGAAIYKGEIILLIRVAERPINNNQQVMLCPVFNNLTGKIDTMAFSKSDSAYDFSDSRTVRGKGKQYLSSISHFRVARSKDGINFRIEDSPAMIPDNMYEEYGIEDSRISKIDDIYYINYSAISSKGVVTELASTKDFVNFDRHGVIFGPDNKDVVIFTEKINGRYYCIHRPSSGVFGCNDMWISESDDLIKWGNSRFLLGTREGLWDSDRIGAGTVPIMTDKGWLEIYHGADEAQRYCLGAVLLDRNEPWKVLARSDEALIVPDHDYELEGFFGNVVFTCGAVEKDESLRIYYGAADEKIAVADVKIDDILETLSKEKGRKDE